MPTSGQKSCFKCPDRYLGCHSKCESYIQAQILNEQVKKKNKEITTLTSFEIDRKHRLPRSVATAPKRNDPRHNIKVDEYGVKIT